MLNPFSSRTDEYHMTKTVLMADVSGWLVQSRLRLGWMDGVKVSFGSNWICVRLHDNAQKIGRSGEPLCICRWLSLILQFLLGLSFGLQITLPRTGGLSPRDWWDAIT